MDGDKFIREDKIRKANGMSEIDRVEFLHADLDEKYAKDLEQMWANHYRFAKHILGVCFFMLLFMAFFV